MAPLCTELEGNADAVEFCSTPPYLHVLAAASYTLQEGPTPTRVGGLYLFSVDESLEALERLQYTETSGIFDIKWKLSEGSISPCLGQASADGTVHLYALREGYAGNGLALHETAMLEVDSSMCLSLDWSPVSSESQIAVSHSDGSISVMDVGQSDPVVTMSWRAHGFETWTTSYDTRQPNLLYSGADDCHFCGWDLREDSYSPIFRNKNSHQMGVCSVQSNPQHEHITVTGSYDESLRLWDMRMIQSPLLKIELGLGGGVWRLKWHPFDRSLVLAACMHNGFAIISVDGEGMKVVEEYKGHESLAYGADWYKGNWGNTADSTRCTGSSISDPENCTVAVSLTQYLEPFRSGKDPPAGGDVSCERDELLIVEERDDMQNARVSKESREKCMGKEDRTRGLRSLVATCSFYDKALHIWEPAMLDQETQNC